jgi:hypothetical protein
VLCAALYAGGRWGLALFAGGAESAGGTGRCALLLLCRLKAVEGWFCLLEVGFAACSADKSRSRFALCLAGTLGGSWVARSESGSKAWR